MTNRRRHAGPSRRAVLTAGLSQSDRASLNRALAAAQTARSLAS